MNYIEISAYVNFHSSFTLNSGQEVSGVLLPFMGEQTNHTSNIYKFIPSINLREYKIATNEQDQQKKQSLETTLNIFEVANAKRIGN